MTIPDLIRKIDLFWHRSSTPVKWSIVISVAIILFLL